MKKHTCNISSAMGCDGELLAVFAHGHRYSAAFVVENKYSRVQTDAPAPLPHSPAQVPFLRKWQRGGSGGSALATIVGGYPALY